MHTLKLYSNLPAAKFARFNKPVFYFVSNKETGKPKV